MSIFTLGMNDISEDMQAMKDKLASKDAQVVAQQGDLMKKAEEMQEMRRTLNDVLQKLNSETSRVLQLETSLGRVTTDLQNSSLSAQNTSAALASTEERLRLKDLEAKELENTLISLSRDSEGQETRFVKIEQEKRKSEARVKELESALKAVAIPPVAPRTPARSRSSSSSDLRITTMENELAELHATLVSRDAEMRTIQTRLEVAQRDALKANNEKMASEARLNSRMTCMESEIAEREEELQYLREQGGSGGLEREEELLKRIDEDEAKIQALERLIGDAHDVPLLKENLEDCEEKLRLELSRASELEDRSIELVQEKEEILDELEDARDRITELETQNRELSTNLGRSSFPSHLNEEAVINMEKLLGAVERLRGERDSLRRDMQFLDMESKFTIAALEAKVASLSSTHTTYDASFDDNRIIPSILITPSEGETLSQNSTISTASEGQRKEIERLRGLVLGCSLVISQVETNRKELEGQRDAMHFTCEEKSNGLALAESQLHDAESRLTTTIQLLEETTSQRNDTMSRLTAIDTEWRTKLEAANTEQQESKTAVDHLNAQLDEISRMLEAVTSERDSLYVQVTNLNSDITSAREELTEAESRYTQLQFHQLSDMPSTQATKTLRSQIEDLEGRIMRRTEQIGIHQHDIRRLETNLRLQEERLTEMTSEMEMIVAQKDAMVEDCADAREQRDEALSNVERLEEEVERLESLLEDRNKEQEAIIEVMFLNSARTKEKMSVETGQIEEMRERTQSLLEEHDNTLHNVQILNEELQEAKQRLSSSEQEAKRATDSFALSQAELTRSLMSTQDLEKVRTDLSGQVRELEDQLRSSVGEVATLASRLESLQQETSTTIKQRVEMIAGLESQLEDARTLLSSKEADHRAALENLRQQIIQKDRLLTNNDLEGELVQLKVKHVEELAQLQSRLIQVTTTLDEFRARHDSAQVEHQQSLADSAQSKAQIEQQLQETDRELHLLKELKEALQAANRKHADEIRRLEECVAASNSELNLARDNLDKSGTSLQRSLDELAQTQQDYEKLLTEARNALAETRTRLDEESTTAVRSREQAAALQKELDEEMQGRSQDRSFHEEALQSAKECQDRAELRVEQMGQDVLTLETQIQDATAQIRNLQDEKKTVQRDMTALEANVQRSLSMNRHLESQIRESEHTITNLRSELEHVNNHLAKVEKACNAAEVNLSLQNVQHKREVSRLQQEVETLKSRPELESVVAELEERINEMEDLLRRKCEEIEENDDVKLGLMKENKSLKTKVESLTRKVNNLQTKLAAAKATLPAPTAVEQRIPSSSSIVSVSSSSSSPSASFPTSSTSRPHSNTMVDTPGTSISFNKTSPPAVPERLNRVVSVPSALPRPKTPERRNVLGPVFRAMSPKKPKRESSPVTQTKKRRAPDDFEGYEIPPQAFTADSLPGEGENVSEHATPKVRRVLSSIQTGFTPARHQNRPMIPMPSPKRSNPVFIKSPPSVPDLSASLSYAGQPVDGKKRSWLGKIRGASSTPGQRDFT